ncbi:MAG: hypothetical protein U9N30_09535 [Campylobacterota bacterium]|nr:hypothetical protein [Campylobacterota bacterium]
MTKKSITMKIMATAFPKLEDTKWYMDQVILAKQGVGVVVSKENAL